LEACRPIDPTDPYDGGMLGRVGVLLVGLACTAVACSSGDPGVREAGARGNDSVVTAEESSETIEVATSDDEQTTPVDEPAAEYVPEPIDWDQFDDEVDVATLVVPVDYDDPGGATFELFIAKYNALDQENRIGTLLVNPGGPGFGGSDFAFFASEIFDRALLERFDILGWDPRGTGESEPAIDCIDDYDPYFNEIDTTPDSDAERQELVDTAEAFADECVSRNADIIEHIGTNNSARDMDAIRRSLGEETISYFGFSYGSELGAAWATLFPESVRAAVLDGASDPEADALESSLQQARGFEASLTTFLERCSADEECAFHNDGDAEGAFDALMAELDANPLPSADGRPPVSRDVAVTGIVQAMYSESFWPALEQSLAAAQIDGDGSGLLELNDSYYQRSPDGTYGNELEAFQAISCADTAERKSIEETDAENAQFTAVAPRLAPEGAAGGYFCTFFPDSLDPRTDITGAGAGPIMVIGTTGDPATPFDSTVRMSDALEDGRLVIVEADQHTGYGVNRCVIDVVNDYLIDLAAPTDGTECR
jgi:pimeloyl-ACP methyl ester carboxylesterase